MGLAFRVFRCSGGLLAAFVVACAPALFAQDKSALPKVSQPPAKDAKLVAGPAVTRTDAGVVISFAVDKTTDVTMRILAADGKVIRVPDDIKKSWTYNLLESDATYIVTRPLSDGISFTPADGVKNITIDLNGHTMNFGGDIKARVVRGGLR